MLVPVLPRVIVRAVLFTIAAAAAVTIAVLRTPRIDVGGVIVGALVGLAVASYELRSLHGGMEMANPSREASEVVRGPWKMLRTGAPWQVFTASWLPVSLHVGSDWPRVTDSDVIGYSSIPIWLGIVALGAIKQVRDVRLIERRHNRTFAELIDQPNDWRTLRTKGSLYSIAAGPRPAETVNPAESTTAAA